MNGRNLYNLLIIALVALSAESLLACGNQHPIAQIDHDETPWEILVTPGTTVVLDGSDSYDPDGYITWYHWNLYRWNGSYYAFYGVVSWEEPVFELEFDEAGSYQVELDVQDDDDAFSYYSDGSWVLAAEVTIDDYDEYLSYDGGNPVEIDYTLEPEDEGFRHTVTLVIKDDASNTVKTIELPDDLGSGDTAWNGTDDSSQPVEPGVYTATVLLTVGSAGYFEDSCTIYVVMADLDIDTDNDGTIEESEDAIEAYAPGAILPENLEGDGAGLECRKEITLTAVPIVPGGRVLLYGDMPLFESETGGQMIGYSKLYNVAELPSSLWVGQAEAGLKTISLLYNDSHNNTLAQDQVSVLVTETVSHSPRSDVAYLWQSFPSSPSSSHNFEDGDVFEAEFEDQGYDFVEYVDITLNTTFGGCTLANYRDIFTGGALHVISHGDRGIHFAVYSSTAAACDAWRSGEEDMDTLQSPCEGWYGVAVKSAWLEDNSSLTSNDAIVHWAICFSATGGNGGGSVMEAAGGRWRIGYRCKTDGALPDWADDAYDVSYSFYRRMSGASNDGELRTAERAWNPDEWPNHTCNGDCNPYYPCEFHQSAKNVCMEGNPWTTMCPAPMEYNSVWPDSDPGEREGWGCIIFDTYVDSSLSAANALVCDAGGPISERAWCAETGYGKFALGFWYDNRGGGGGTIRADASNCVDEGGKEMDGDRETPNEDDRTWEY